MSFYDMYSIVWPRLDPERVDALVNPDMLAVARIEPVFSPRRDALLDLAFELNGEWTAVPMLRVEGLTLLTRETPPVTWPIAFREFGARRLRKIEERLLPWLRSITTGRYFNHEAIRFFSQSDRVAVVFQDAREATFFGASPYRDVFKALAPGVYAQRFARDRTVAIAGPNAGNHLAVLSSVARECAVEQNDLSARWFGGIASIALDRSREYDCYVGPREVAQSSAFSVFESQPVEGELPVIVAEPVPTDVIVSFDPEDAPVARTFSVPQREIVVSPSSVALSHAVGGSSGRIALILREDGEKFSDADTDAAHALAAALHGEGFDATVCTPERVDVSSMDVVHVFGLRHGAGLVALLRDAEAAAVPVVVTAYADDRRQEALTMTHGALAIPRGGAADPETTEEYLSALARRKIANLTAGSLYDEVADTIMRRAGVALVSCAAEESFLRERFAYQHATVVCPPAVANVEPDANVGAFIGPSDYVLLHAPLDPVANQLFVLRAAQRTSLPLVLLGPVQHGEYFRYITEAAGPGCVLLRDAGLSDAEMEAVYARARVVVDVGATSRGLERLARGMAHGASVVAGKASYAGDMWGDVVVQADVMDIYSIEAALVNAWNRQPADAQRLRSSAAKTVSAQGALLAAVSAYATAAGVAVH